MAQLSENPVEGVCGWCLFAKQEIFLSSTVFSITFFRLKQTLTNKITTQREFDKLPSSLYSD